jgi:Ca2+-binding RTX toxin-like protein
MNPMTDQQGVENHPFSFLVSDDTFFDSDIGDTLSYSTMLEDGSPLPSWLNFNPETRIFSAVPGLNDAGTLSLIVTATDKLGLSSSNVFKLNITNLIEATPDDDDIIGSEGDDYILAGAGNDTVDGGNGNDVIAGGIGSDLLNGGAGDDIFLIDGINKGSDRFEGGSGFDTIQGGDANDTIRVKDFHGIYTVEKIDGGLGDNYLVGTRHNDNIDLSATLLVNINSIEGRAGNDKIIGSSSADTLDGGIGKDTLSGGAGNDTYILGRGYGVDTIIEDDGTLGNADSAQFLADIAADQIWFKHVRSNLEVSVIGTTDKLVIKDWYSNSASHVEEFKTADYRTLFANQVETLVSAMASFAPPAAGQITLSNDYQRTLSPIIAANWQ